MVKETGSADLHPKCRTILNVRVNTWTPWHITV